MTRNKLTQAVLCLTACFAVCFALSAYADAASEGGTIASETPKTGVNNSDKTSQYGVGAVLGTSTGVATEYWTSNMTAFGLNIVSYHNTNLAVSFGHNWFARTAFQEGFMRDISPYGGVQALGVFGTSDDSLQRRDDDTFFGRNVFAAQVPLGVAYLPQTRNFGAFAEVLPGFEVSPYGYFFMAGDLGARMYF
jgi:hypothetical protein